MRGAAPNWFPHDSPVFPDIWPSPNFGERRGGRRPDMLLLHYTGMASSDQALERLCHSTSEVSAHYLIFEDGRVLQLVSERCRAWHAGAGAWAGDRDINTCSIGIEIANPGHAGGLPPYPPAQMEAVTRLCRDILARNTIVPRRILGHSDIAPDRKEDPGERFPWDALHAAGIGHWVPPAPIEDGEAMAIGSEGDAVATFQAALAGYGYPIDATGRFGKRTAAAVTAFQRHFRPERVDGIADLSTRATLRDLIAALPAT